MDDQKQDFNKILTLTSQEFSSNRSRNLAEEKSVKKLYEL